MGRSDIRMTLCPDATKYSRFFPVDLRWSMRHWLVLIHLVLRWRRAHQDWTCSRLIATELSHVAYELGRFYSFALRVWKTSTSKGYNREKKFATPLLSFFSFFFFCEIERWTANDAFCLIFTSPPLLSRLPPP